jgi:hypothetical protein
MKIDIIVVFALGVITSSEKIRNGKIAMQE